MSNQISLKMLRKHSPEENLIKYRIIPNRSTGGLDKSPRVDYIRFREPCATVTNMIYERNRPSKLRALLLGGVPLLEIIRYY